MAADRIRNGEWMGDLELKDDLTDYLKRNWRKNEILDFIQTKYPMYTLGVSGLCPADYNILILNSLITR